MKKSFVAALSAVVIVSGCQTAPKGPLPQNSIVINASKVKTKEAIIATFMPRNYQIVRDTDFQLVLDRPASDNFGAQLLYGSKFNTVPNARALFTITGDNPTTVLTQIQLVTNPGSGFEQVVDLNNHHDSRTTIATQLGVIKQLAESK